MGEQPNLQHPLQRAAESGEIRKAGNKNEIEKETKV